MSEKERMEKCPYADKCGGCRYQGLSYRSELFRKQAELQKLLGGFGKISPILGAKKPEHYRMKVQAAFGYDYKHKPVCGTYRPSTHTIVPVVSCGIENEKADRIIRSVLSEMGSFGITAYDEKTEKGFLRHVLVRCGQETGEILVVLVAAEESHLGLKGFAARLLELHPEITTLILNVNDRYTSMVLGKKEKILFGNGYITDKLCGLSFRISASSFYQVNPPQAKRLYETAIRMADLKGYEWVLDAYCGTGTIGLCAAGKAGQVIGVELNRDAVRDAVNNAKENHIGNARFIAMDAGAYLEEAVRHGQHFDAVLMDPPRTGSTKQFLSALLKAAPDRIVYISCGPDTLARDLKILTAGAYRVKEIQPVDMFPRTAHIEVVVSLERGIKSPRKG